MTYKAHEAALSGWVTLTAGPALQGHAGVWAENELITVGGCFTGANLWEFNGGEWFNMSHVAPRPWFFSRFCGQTGLPAGQLCGPTAVWNPATLKVLVFGGWIQDARTNNLYVPGRSESQVPSKESIYSL